jgi:hypothetical protein
MTKVITRATAYRVGIIPEALAPMDADTFCINVEYRGNDLWAVKFLSRCLDSEGRWDYEPQPSSREDEWLATHRFDLDTALRLAIEAAPNVRINGKTALEVLATHQGSPSETGA